MYFFICVGGGGIFFPMLYICILNITMKFSAHICILITMIYVAVSFPRMRIQSEIIDRAHSEAVAVVKFFSVFVYICKYLRDFVCILLQMSIWYTSHK